MIETLHRTVSTLLLKDDISHVQTEGKRESTDLVLVCSDHVVLKSSILLTIFVVSAASGITSKQAPH